ncbi:hypothetical protein [Rhizobium leguminosarum]|uniref:hypothetical protein n=1 Tax=Rhizobium leguminosarum TaxID=384 RepID=UPI001C96730E|nr:hypothetical protein [Rhizobium leguminosarum]MBY5511859.1 hypothetical protein [Rhizobium leguminosarum]
MSVPFEPILPPPSVPPLDNPPDPDRIPGEEPLPDPEPDEGAAPVTRSSPHCPTCVKGAKQSDVYDAIVEEIGNLRGPHDRDPDPAEDRPGAEAEEPSNEWPGALP